MGHRPAVGIVGAGAGGPVGHRPAVGIVGTGHAGMALAVALTRAGWPVRAVSSRDAGRRADVAAVLPDAQVARSPTEVAAVADLILLAVPDDAIRVVATGLGARPGSVVTHLSGVHPAEVLRDLVAPGVAVGALHPLVAFADAERGAMALDGAYVVIDGDAQAVATLRSLVDALGARPVVLAPGDDRALVKAAHHAAAVLAAGGFVALLDAIVALGRIAGLDEATAIAAYGSLVHQGLANADVLGVDAALTGPVARGDTGTVRAHLATIDTSAPDLRELYLAMARRQLTIAERRGGLAHDAADALESLLDDRS